MHESETDVGLKAMVAGVMGIVAVVVTVTIFTSSDVSTTTIEACGKACGGCGVRRVTTLTCECVDPSRHAPVPSASTSVSAVLR